MNPKNALSLIAAVALSAASAQAWNVSGVVSCPNGATASGITVKIDGVGSTTTDGGGAYIIDLPTAAATYTICVDPNSLPAGTTVGGCQTFSVDWNNLFGDVDFTLSGSICSTNPTPGLCWLTGGGTIGKTKGQPDYSYGGVVNPGCSPTAAGGGNWNVVDHLQGLHFKGQNITVLACGGVPTLSPKVDVNTIDFAGTGILEGVEGNPQPVIPVCFIAHAEDHHEPGAGKDSLYLDVMDCTTGVTLMLISTDAANPADVAPVLISTGNLQIHTSSCGK